MTARSSRLPERDETSKKYTNSFSPTNFCENFRDRLLGGRSPPIPVPCPPGGVWGASPPQESPIITRALPPQRPCLAPVPCPQFFFVQIFSSEFFRPNFFVGIFFVRRRSVVRPSVVRSSVVRPWSVRPSVRRVTPSGSLPASGDLRNQLTLVP